ncbi:WD repeat-containing protein 47 [Phytophthora citrophthora]|uniref:WD repeat-containing protein 47 n=1 Tax=Phytophthora citrophthora TaxID=4793 RepID=A0AAD9LR92_9STRA|nr:WD repeat-containing protein 47 [Phytophthora citrophthora]
MSLLPRHSDVLYLVVKYLQANGLYASSLALQQESGLDVSWLRGSSREIALLRHWLFAGDVTRARALLSPLQGLDEVSEEMKAALMALDELEVLMKTQPQHSRLAKEKLRCFESLVRLFRAPVEKEESEVFKYVAMPELQLGALIHDAVLFHRQTGDDTARDCISVRCSGYENGMEQREEGYNLLLLDELLYEDSAECAIPLKAESVVRSEEWPNGAIKQRNPMVVSVNLGRQHINCVGAADQLNRFPDEKKSVDVAVNCEIDRKETADVAVSCELDTKVTVDAGVSCVTETVDTAVDCKPVERQTSDAAVNCEPTERHDGGTQTDNLPQEEAEHILEDGSCNGEGGDQRVELENTNSMSIEAQGGLAEQQVEQSTGIQDAVLSSAEFTDKSWAQNNSRGEMFGKSALPPEQENLQQYFDEEAEFVPDISLLTARPQCYNELKLDHVVCASVIAEVKEPQAVRALDVHPSGGQLAVGTNARALRVFNLSTPLQRRQEQMPWSSPLNLILPLLPVTLERHKHHNSGVYCVSYNRHLLHRTDLTSMIASGAADGSIKVLITRDYYAQKQQADEFWIQRGDIHGSMGKTRALKFASPHYLWTTSTNDRRLRCWDIRQTQGSSNSGAFQTLDGHVGEIQAIAIPQPSSSGSSSTLLLSSALDTTVRLWDTRSRRCERLVTSGAYSAFSLDFHPTDEKLVASGHQDGSLALWDLRSTAREALQVISPHQDECRSVQWAPGGQWLLSAAFDGTLCILQATSKATLQPVASYHKHYGKVLQAQWHPTEPAFVSSGADKRVKLWAFA